MKKQKGFTLIELMVVMAIIAILATAGLSAYTGYIKKARDTKRIADLNAINTIVLASMASTGLPPQSIGALSDLIKASNNGKRIVDPLTVWVETNNSCLSYAEVPTTCNYVYITCDGGIGYVLGAYFESTSNLSLYTENINDASNNMYRIWSCTKIDDGHPHSLDSQL